MSEQNQSEQNPADQVQPDRSQPEQSQTEQNKGDQDNAPKGTSDLEDDTARLAAEVQEARANNRRGTVSGGKGRLLAGTALGGACALFIAVMFWPKADMAAQATLPTGQPAAFQTNEEPFARMPLPARREPEPDPRMLAQIEALEAEIERLRQQPQQDVEITVEDDVPPVEDEPVVSNDPQIDSLLAQVSQLQEQAPIHPGLLEVETGQITMHREFGHVHLVTDRAHRAVGVLRLQQMLDQPARSLQSA